MTSLNNILKFYSGSAKTLQIVSGVYTSEEEITIEPGDVINLYSAGVRMCVSPGVTIESNSAWASGRDVSHIFVASDIGLLVRTSYTSLSSLVNCRPKNLHGTCGVQEKYKTEDAGDSFFDYGATHFTSSSSNSRKTLQDRETTDNLVFYSDDIINGSVPLPIMMSFANIELQKTFELATGLKEFIVSEGKPSVCLAIKIGKAIENVNRGMALIRGVQCLNFGTRKLNEIKAKIVENRTLEQITAQYATNTGFDPHNFRTYDLYVKTKTTNEVERLYMQMSTPIPQVCDDFETCSITDYGCSLNTVEKRSRRCSDTDSIYVPVNELTPEYCDDFETCSSEFSLYSTWKCGEPYTEPDDFKGKVSSNPKRLSPIPKKWGKETGRSSNGSFNDINSKIQYFTKNQTKTDDTDISIRRLSNELRNHKTVSTDSSRREHASETRLVNDQTFNFSNSSQAKPTQKVRPLQLPTPDSNFMETNPSRAKYSQEDMANFWSTSKDVSKFLNTTKGTARQTRRQENNQRRFETLTVSEIVHLMENQNLSKVAKVCKENNIDGNFLVMMIKEEDLSSDPFFLDPFEIKRYMWLRNGNLPQP